MSLLAWITFAVIGITAALRQTRLLYRLNGASDLKRRGRVDDDSFTFQACRSAGFLSLVVTGGTLGILQHVSTQVALPGAFFIKLALFICCASFVTCYCIITRATDDAATGS